MPKFVHPPPDGIFAALESHLSVAWMTSFFSLSRTLLVLFIYDRYSTDNSHTQIYAGGKTPWLPYPLRKSSTALLSIPIATATFRSFVARDQAEGGGVHVVAWMKMFVRYRGLHPCLAMYLRNVKKE
ncbi:hypothetical protein DFH29DRAFT_1071379 [Suillus ampliporus]|nr:hypothetical protein DFH29DRAFT_1071379 [Suillus ampliporus]